MLEPHGSPMKWPGAGVEEEGGEGSQGARAPPARPQDEGPVHYVFPREGQDEIANFTPKQRWAVGDDNAVEVSIEGTLSILFYYSL